MGRNESNQTKQTLPWPGLFHGRLWIIFNHLALILPIILSRKCCLLFTSAAYIQIDFRILLIMESYTMNPDQTAPEGAVWSGCILFAIYATEVDKQMKADDNCGKWREKG